VLSFPRAGETLQRRYDTLLKLLLQVIMKYNKINEKTLFCNKINKGIYLDYQASTPIDAYVLKKMFPYMTADFGNPHSSEHSVGWKANAAVENSQWQIAKYINALTDEIIFTSGATESNNLAISGIGYTAIEKKYPRKTILISSIEHKCVLGAARFLTRFGFSTKKIPVEKNGIIDVMKLKSLLSGDVLLVSVMATNNEIGVNQPIKEIGKICKENNIMFHVDAAQGAYTNLDVVDNNVDFMSISAHKIYGPKGIGILFISQNAILKPTPILNGGGQQLGYRSGTVPTFLVVGMGAATELMLEKKEDERTQLSRLRQRFLIGLKQYCPDILVNGDIDKRHPGNLNILLPTIEAKQLILSLQPHIAFSTGSACTSGVIEPSHVLRAIGLSTEEAERSFRITVGRFTDDSDIEHAIKLIGKNIS
jgi:cysteine desulfurase